MAKIENIEDRRLGERLTAHLAMGAAGEPEVTGDCLSDEQLADVATNFCTKEEKAAALAHFSSCPRCYNGWVAVSMSLMAIESGTTTPFKWHRSIKTLTYLGSVLAVAASVVVFLNIREMSTLSEMSSLETGKMQSVERRQNVVPASPAVIPRAEEQRLNQVRKPSAPATLKKSTPVFGDSATAVVAERAGEGEAESTSQTTPEMSSAVRSVKEMTPESDELKGLSAAGWLGGVEALCKGLQDMRDMARWNTLQQVGRTIAGQESNAVLRQRIEAVLAIMNTVDEQPGMAEQCSRIMPLLAGEGDTM